MDARSVLFPRSGMVGPAMSGMMGSKRSPVPSRTCSRERLNHSYMAKLRSGAPRQEPECVRAGSGQSEARREGAWGAARGGPGEHT